MSRSQIGRVLDQLMSTKSCQYHAQEGPHLQIEPLV